MNASRELQQWLSTGNSISGSVVALTGDLIKVRTSQGIRTVRKGIATELALGDIVRIANDVLVGRLRRESAVPVYYM